MSRVQHSSHSLFTPGEEELTEFEPGRGLGPQKCSRFRKIVQDYYVSNRREFDWRQKISPYRVFVSEIMLQQTQTQRVVPKFSEFICRFPDFKTLAEAPFSEVLRYWKGLGYNRRAKYLQASATTIIELHGGILPEDPDLLVRLPGIGPATAASMIVFAYNRPLAFIETNIRTVFIYFFFPHRQKVLDSEIMSLVSETLDRDDPRQWYYALMDYGVMLKKNVGNLGRKSSGYKKQSRFEGSDRQLRGKILQLLLDHGTMSEEALAELLQEDPERTRSIVSALCDEKILVRHDNRVLLG